MARIQDNSRFNTANNYQNQKHTGLHSTGFGRAQSFAPDLEPMLPEGTSHWTNSKANGNMIAADTNSKFALPSTVNGISIDPQTGIPQNSFFGNQAAAPMAQQPTQMIPMVFMPMTNSNNTGMPTTASSFPMSNNPMANTVMQMMSMMQSMIGMMMQFLQGNMGGTQTQGTGTTTGTDTTTATAGSTTGADATTNPDGTGTTTGEDTTTGTDGTAATGDCNNPCNGTNTDGTTTGADGTGTDDGTNTDGSTPGTDNTGTPGETPTGADGTGTDNTNTGTDADGLTDAQKEALKANPGAALDPHADIDRDKNFHDENLTERAEDGLDDHDRAIVHLWGRQIISAGKQDGGILLNVEGNVDHTFTTEEHKVADDLIAKDKAKYGGITGKSLDEEFFKIMQKMHPGVTLNTAKWMDTPVNFATGPVNMISDVGDLQKQTGLSEFDQGVLRLWGHDPLMNGGKIDGSVLAYTVGNPNALDNIANAGNKDKTEDIDIDNIATGLLKADLTQDGVRNGDSLSFAFGRVLDKVYLGKTDDNMANVQKNAETKATAAKRTPTQIAGDVAKGMKQAATDTAQIIKDHPFLSASAVAAAAAAGTVCPFLGGLAIGGAGIAAGQKLLNSNKGNTDNN